MAEQTSREVISGKYRLLTKLGEGAMGTVFLAEQLDIEGRVLRQVAFKTMRRELSSDPAFARRFLREVRVAAQLRNPHTVMVHDSGQGEDGQLYFVMEYVNGPTLRQVLRQQGAFPVDRALRIGSQICEALAEAHSLPEPVVHRDLKPPNIFIEQRQGQDWVEIGDFGIAKVLSEQTEGLTQVGQASPGTPVYMAPEQWRGTGEDGRTDLYTLGIILHELLTGKLPFVANSVEALMHQHLSVPPPPLPNTIPVDLRTLVARLLAKAPQDRPTDAGQVQYALETMLKGNDERPTMSENSPEGRAPSESSQTGNQTKSRGPTSNVHNAQPALAQPLRLVLLHKRHAQPDEQVVQFLDTQLTANRHQVFVDRHLSIGMKWAQELERQMQEADVVIPLLSEASVQSEMLAYEVETVREEAQRNNGKPRLLPIRLNFAGPLPEDLGRVLGPLPSLLWQGLHDNQQLVSDVLGALQKPLTPPVPLRPEELRPYEGAIPLGSPVYVARPIDEEFYDAIARRDSVVLVKGARQMGKTSVLARGLQRARDLGYRTVMTDFQSINASQLETADILYQALCGVVADDLGLQVTPDVTWKSFRGPNQNFEHYMRTEVMAKVSTPLVWGLDEVDQLFNRPFASEVFGLLRSWHNARALDPDSPWSRLTLAIAHATEPHLFIADLNQSPFNVGTRLTLQDFTFPEVMHLNGLYGSPLKTEAEVTRFVHVVGGQPFLVHRSLYLFAKAKLDLVTLERQADRDEGPFNPHLGRLLLALARDPDLCEVVRNLLRKQPCTDQKSFYRLRSGGVLIGETMQEARLRCQMYATYLERHLL